MFADFKTEDLRRLRQRFFTDEIQGEDLRMKRALRRRCRLETEAAKAIGL
jgi:hypothetical protein